MLKMGAADSPSGCSNGHSHAQRISEIDARRQGIAWQGPRLQPNPPRGTAVCLIDEPRDWRFVANTSENTSNRSGSPGGVEEQVDPVAGGESRTTIIREKRLYRLPIDRHDPWGVTLDLERQTADTGCIDHPDTQALARLNRDIRLHGTIDQQRRMRLRRIRRPQHEHDVAIGVDRLTFLDDQGSIEPAVGLVGGICAIVERSRIRRSKAVIEAASRLDQRLRQAGDPIHGVGQPHAGPMHAGWLGQIIDELYV